MLQQLYATTKQGKWSVGGPVLVWNILYDIRFACPLGSGACGETYYFKFSYSSCNNTPSVLWLVHDFFCD